MGGFIGVLGLAVAAFGFIVMRNPMRMAMLSPGKKGYYQRVLLDAGMRNQLRMVGAVMCLFGGSIFMFELSWITKAQYLKSVAEGIWVLTNCIFWAGFCLGVILTIKQLIQGKFLDWLRIWWGGTPLGPTDVFPAVTPEMRKEAAFFTVALLALVCVAVLISVLR